MSLTKNLCWKKILETIELLNCADVSDKKGVDWLRNTGANAAHEILKNEKGSTDFIKVTIPEHQGQSSSGTAPTLGVLLSTILLLDNSIYG